jgi:hypothetical protein
MPDGAITSARGSWGIGKMNLVLCSSVHSLHHTAEFMIREWMLMLCEIHTILVSLYVCISCSFMIFGLFPLDLGLCAVVGYCTYCLYIKLSVSMPMETFESESP